MLEPTEQGASRKTRAGQAQARGPALDRIVVLRSWGSLLTAGVALDEALSSVASGHAASEAGAALDKALSEVRAGRSLHDALVSSTLDLAPHIPTLVRGARPAASSLKPHRRRGSAGGPAPRDARAAQCPHLPLRAGGRRAVGGVHHLPGRDPEVRTAAAQQPQ